MANAYICDAVRTPFGRYGGALAALRTDDLAALPIRRIVENHPTVDWSTVDDVVLGCANQAGEDNRNVARMALLLAGMPEIVPGTTVNRLCGSSMDAVAIAARAIACGDADLVIAGGVEGMSRAPFVLGKAESAFSRNTEVFDTTLGWRFINPKLKARYGVDSMSETAENVASEFGISRSEQDAFAYRSQQRWAAAQRRGFFRKEITPVTIPRSKGESRIFDTDEHPRPETTPEGLGRLKPIVRADGTVTAGNASGINDGSCALLLASERAVERYGLSPKARILGSAVVGNAPRIMGVAPVGAVRRLSERIGIAISKFDVVELNEAFAAQAIAVLRELGISEDAEHVNPNGGAIAIGHPLGASGARLLTTAVYQLAQTGAKYALCTMCIGVGQGIAMAIERF